MIEFAAWTTDLLLAATSSGSSLAAWGGTLWNIVRVFIGLGFVIFIHELGHFLAAKFFGVKCEKFYVGFDVPISLGPIRIPAKLFHFQWGETEYGIGSIPLGGYVKMLGQDDDPRRMEEENERIRNAPTGEAEAVGRAQYDPRSFPAKNVFARMVIISAGVIMNIISGIILAAIAFKIGVPYDSTMIGDVVPGDPAWEAGLRGGDHIVQVADMTKPDSKMSFSDMQESIVMSGFDNPTKPIPIVVNRNGEDVRFDIVGTTRHELDGMKIVRLGFATPRSTIVGSEEIFEPQLRGKLDSTISLPEFQPEDKIVAINGVELGQRVGFESPLGNDLESIMHPNFDQTLKVTVERPKKDSSDKGAERVELAWAPVPRRTIQVQFEPGPVAAIQKNSIAEKAGVQVGDTLESINGEPISDAFTLPMLVAQSKGKSVTLRLRRMAKDGEAGEAYNLEWQVPERFTVYDASFQYNPVGLELPGSGLVYGFSNAVAGSKPSERSDGKSETILPGEKVLNVRLDSSNTVETIKLIEKILSTNDIKKLVEGRELKEGYTSAYLNSLVQHLPLGTKLKLDFIRDGVVMPASVVIGLDRDWKSFDRGVMFQPAKLKRTASNFSEAFSLGWAEIQDKSTRVVRFLRMAFTGKLPYNAAGGPGMIFYAATSAASESTTKLLLFLTMLSANLAILNFLPIPALDGGHMVFLIWEAIFRRPVNEAVQMRLTIVGVLALLSLMAFVIANDIVNFTRFFGR